MGYSLGDVMLSISAGRNLRQLSGVGVVLSVLSVPMLGIAGESFATTVETAQPPAKTSVATALPEEKYPRMLQGDDLATHFSKRLRVEANPRTRPFSLSLSQGKAERFCSGCRVTQDIGKVHVKPNENLVCIEWQKSTYPDSGCFNLIQTDISKFELRTPAGQTVISYTVSASSVTANTSGKPSSSATGAGLSRSIIFNVSAYQVSSQGLINAGQQAFRQRGWSLEPCEKDCLRGRLEKNGTIHQAEMRFRAPYVEIGFVADFEEGKAGWLENLKKDTLAALNSPK